jgi:apolipoprotein N-acyltransferase
VERPSVFISKAWPWFAAAFSGLFLALCFPRWSQSWLAWFALAPLTCALWFSENNWRRGWLKNAALGFCAGVGYFGGSFYWLRTVTGVIEPAPLGWLAWLMLVGYLALYPAAWAWFTGTFFVREKTKLLLNSAHNLWVAFAGAAAWVGLEWLRGVVFSGFGWNALGVALHRNLPFIQIADITGIGGVSFVLVFCNLMTVLFAVRIVHEIRETSALAMRLRYEFTLTIALIFGVFFYGIHELRLNEIAMPLRLACVQANIAQTEKFDAQFEQKIFDQYRKLTSVALASRPQLLIWPEASTPRDIDDAATSEFVHEFAKNSDANFLLGTLLFTPNGDFNVALLLTDHGRDEQIYRKTHLVPFGEYMRDSFPLFAKIAGDLVPGDFRPGKNFLVLTTKNPEVKIGALVCFEDTVGEVTRQFVLGGAQLLVNITNDGWFLESEGAEDHLANAIFAAVETRRPLVRATNTGVTCIVDPHGHITQSLRAQDGTTFTEGVMLGVANVPLRGRITFYSRNGELFSLACLSLTVGILITHARRRF